MTTLIWKERRRWRKNAAEVPKGGEGKQPYGMKRTKSFLSVASPLHKASKVTHKAMAVTASGGGYSTLVWVGVCRWDFWNATHPCTHFELKGKVTHPCTKNQNFSLKFAPFWRKFRKILKSWPIKVPNLRHFGANFRKFWKIDPSKYHVFEKKGTHWCTWRPDFATHVCGTSL